MVQEFSHFDAKSCLHFAAAAPFVDCNWFKEIQTRQANPNPNPAKPQ